MKDENGDLSYLVSMNSTQRLTDHLGSVVAITDDEGTLVSQQRYLPFGGIRNIASGPIVQTDYGYTGQRNLDEGIGLMDYKARFYSPVLNRFIQPDSIVPGMFNPQNLNRFSYVGNNPINFNDPTGHCGTPITLANIINGSYTSSGGICANLGNNNGSNNTNNGLQIGSNVSVSGIQSGTMSLPSSINYSVTEWLSTEISVAWDSDAFSNPEECLYGMLEGCLGYQIGSLYGSHYKLFGNKGIYNIKIPMLKSFPNGAIILCGSQGCRWVDYSTAGNIMFGVLSARRGINHILAWRMGGLLEITDSMRNKTPYTGTPGALFDNPGDKAAVDWGWQFALDHPNGFTFEEFQNALTMDELQSFQDPPLGNYPDPQSQNNIYPQGYFLNNQ